MEESTLRRKVRLALEHSNSQVTFFYQPFPERGAPGSSHIGPRPGDVLDGSKVTFTCEAVAVLRALYGSLDAAGRLVFMSELLSLATRKSAEIVVNFLVETGELVYLSRLRDKFYWDVDVALAALDRKLRCQPHLFSERDLKFAETEATQGTLARNPTTGALKNVRYEPLYESVQRVNYLRFRDQLLHGTNPEINTDRRMVLERAAVMGFTPALQKSVNEIDRKLAAAVSLMDFKGVIELMRTCLEEFMEESCAKVQPKIGTPLPTGPKVSHFQPYLQYLRNAGILLPDEQETIQKFYNLLSNEGSHSLEAAPEQARVYRNLNIEFLLLITGRVQACLK